MPSTSLWVRLRASRIRRGVVGALAAASLVCASSPSRAVVVERVVAVAGEHSIFLSELKRRARPYLAQIHASAPSAAEQAARETDAYRDVLNRMIDDRLEEQAADKAHLTVTAEEIDRGIQQKADSVGLTKRQLLQEAERQGLSESDYRDEIRRQVLEGKLLQLRVMSRVRVTEEDVHAAYDAWLKSAKAQGGGDVVDLRVLALPIPSGATSQTVQSTQALAASLVARARGGEDFCQLVNAYGQKPTAQATCGSNGLQLATNLLPPIASAVGGLRAGEISGPIVIGQEAVLVIQVARPIGLPSFDEVKEPMRERATGEAIERQRKAWLQELRRGVYVDMRL